MESIYLLAIDQGTTNSRAMIFDSAGKMRSQHELPLRQSYPQPGWVEQDPQEMFENTLICCREALSKQGLSAAEILAVGISNQRETTIVWDKVTGQPIYPAIVWQDRRTTAICDRLQQESIAAFIPQKTGLRLDPYFSATKLLWLLEHIPGARERATRGELLFGTVDSYLIWRFTHGQSHLTDITNASRTMLFNIHTQTWDDDILTALQIPRNLLPTVQDNTADFGKLSADWLGAAIPIAGVAGDQQAAAIGQACFTPGMVKATYGTGAFMLRNTGTQAVQSQAKLLTTIAYRTKGEFAYGLEGSIFSAGTTVKWLRDSVQLIKSAAETEVLARSIQSTEGVYLIPAFTGLGAPYWDPQARGAIIGLTRNSGRAQIARAALESVAYQTWDLLMAMQSDIQGLLTVLRVDGGMTQNQWLLQFLADILQIKVQCPICIETSALGAAYLAGLQMGVYRSFAEIAKHWQMQMECVPTMSLLQREALLSGWRKALNKK